MSDEKKLTVLSLTSRQKKFLKGLAHPLSPLVLIGKEGLSSGITNTVNAELLNHELIKVKIGTTSSLEKHSTSQTIAEQTKSSLVQLIGKTIILYKANPKIPKDKRIILPKG
jgi:RNA-binding protein